MYSKKIDDLIYEDLRKLRNKWAKMESVLPYHVLSNIDIENLVREKPLSLVNLSKVDGIGDFRLERFGEKIIDFFKSLPSEHRQNTKRKTAIRCDECGKHFFETLDLCPYCFSLPPGR